MSSEIALEVKSLYKSYKVYQKPMDRIRDLVSTKITKHDENRKGQRYTKHVALSDISFTVKRGETVGIIGRNGSGKSTLLQILCGIISPTFGEIIINGQIASLLELGAGFNPEFSGRENVFINGILLGLTKQKIKDRFRDIEQFADIGSYIDQPVKTYSSGMYVRLAFAISIHVDPSILIIDEALAVGDFAFQTKCLSKIKELSQKGTTIIFVTHDINQMQKICTHALYLKNGIMQFYGDPKTASDRYFYDVNSRSSKNGSSDLISHEVTFISSETSIGAIKDKYQGIYAPFRKGTQRDGCIEYVLVNGEFEKIPAIGFCDSLVVTIAFRLEQLRSDNLAICFYVIDTAGQLLIGTNTRIEGIDVNSMSHSKLHKINFCIENRLKDGEYGVMAFLVNENLPSETEYIDYYEVAGKFNVYPINGEKIWSIYYADVQTSIDEQGN